MAFTRSGVRDPSAPQMFYVYILRSKQNGRYYIGYSKDVEDRLARHNAGHTQSTKPYRPWELVYTEEYLNQQLP